MNIENFINTVNTRYPDIKKSRINQITSGQNNFLFSVNDELMFRFPKNDFNMNKLLKEYEFLNKLKDEMLLTIPYTKELVLGKTYKDTYLVYKKIEGKPLRQDIFKTVDDEKVLAKQLAVFLKKLHSETITEKFDGLLLEVDVLEYWKDMHERFTNKLYEFMTDKSIKEMDQNFNRIFETLRKDFKTTVIHGDFGPSNILYEGQTSKISGIIDFSEMMISDPAYDIASLIGPFGYGVDFAKEMTKHYKEIEGYLERALLYKTTFALQEALYGVEHNDCDAFEAGIKTYR